MPLSRGFGGLFVSLPSVSSAAPTGDGTSRPRRLALRARAAADGEHLFNVYASTRTDELAAVPWSDAEKVEFLRTQFDAQQRHYQHVFPNAEFHVIEQDGEAIGRLYVDRQPGEIRIVDIALLPAYRRVGVGSALVAEILREAAETGSRVTIHVEQNNPARSLYDRLGFTPTGRTGPYLLMEWRPPERG